MTMDGNVQPATTSVVEPVAPVVNTVQPIVPTQPSADEILNQKIAEAVAKVVGEQTEKAKREIQSIKDKSVAEVAAAQRRARLAETTLDSTRQKIAEDDPTLAEKLELVALRAEKGGRMTLEQEDEQRRQQETFHVQFVTGLQETVSEMGIDPADKKIDWAEDATNYLEIQKRVMKSVAKIKKEQDLTNAASVDAKIKAAIAQVKKDLGADEANSVNTAPSGGVSGTGIPTDMKQFRTWVASLSQTDYEKRKPEIDKLLEEGKIK